MVTTHPNPDPWPSRRALLLGVPAALLALRLRTAVADDTEIEATPPEPAAPPLRGLATFALG